MNEDQIASFARLQADMGHLLKSVEAIEKHLDKMLTRAEFEGFKVELDRQLTSLRSDLEKQIKGFEADLERERNDTFWTRAKAAASWVVVVYAAVLTFYQVFEFFAHGALRK